MRFGWTFVIGLVPIAGDVTNALINYVLVVRKARKAELPDWLVARMLFNNAVSAGVGFVPLVGDVLLAVYKANSRNAALLDEFLRIRGSEFLKMREAEERGRENNNNNNNAPTAADVEQVKPGAGMTSSEMDANSKDTGSSLTTSFSGAAPTSAKSGGLLSMRPKEQFAVVSKSGPKGRFVENMEL